MEILAIILVVIGIILSLIGSIWFLVESFRANIWWGLGCLFVPFVDLIFLITHWNVAAKPFGISVLGGVIAFAAVFIAPEGFQDYGI